jgi:hypothetical protein
VVGLGTVYRATRDNRAGTMPSYCSKGYPCFRVPIYIYILLAAKRVFTNKTIPISKFLGSLNPSLFQKNTFHWDLS